MQALKLKRLALNPQLLKRTAQVAALAVVIGLLFAFRDQWLPHVRQLITPADSTAEELAQPTDHGHAANTDGNFIELSPQARKNIGLTTAQIVLQPFEKTVSMPALVVERPGRSQVEVTAPLGGRVTRVYPLQGEAVAPGQPLFDLRLTHEELVNAQSELLRSAEEIDVVDREIKRLDSVSIPGAIPGKTKRERQYEKQKLEAVINAQRQSLVLHGLTEEQVANIFETRKLLHGVTVVAPPHLPNGHDGEADHPYHIQRLAVKPGQYVEAGISLCLLADHHELFIEGRAFEQDIERLHLLANEGWTVDATVESYERAGQTITGLRLFYLSDVVETDSRAFHFYVRLPNRMVRDVTDEAGHRFVSWQFKPGQRMQIQVPVERWENRIVLPVDAIAQEGIETFLFEQNGSHFDRVPVHVEHRDNYWAVIEPDPRLLGATVATSAAQQLQMALNNKAGGAAQAHAHPHPH